MTVNISLARRIVFLIHFLAALVAAVLTPIIVVALFVIFWDAVSPGDVFAAFRLLFIRLLSGHGLRPFSLRISLPRGPSLPVSPDAVDSNR